MGHRLRTIRLGSLVAVMLGSAGCKSGSGIAGILELFGGSSGSSSDSGFTISSSTGSVFEDPGVGSVDAFRGESVASVHGAEPASVALFGTGLVALYGLRRRRARQQSLKS